MKITKVSPLSGVSHTLDMPITYDAYQAWSNAADDDPKRFVQVAFPHLDEDQREFLITGITATEWSHYNLGDELPGGDSRPDAEHVAHEADSEVLDRLQSEFEDTAITDSLSEEASHGLDHPTRYTDDDHDDWLGKEHP